MAYYLQGEVHREFIFDCNEYSNQTVPTIQNADKLPAIDAATGQLDGTGISKYNGVGKFRFSLSDDLYIRKTALKWAQIPMVMNTLPEDINSYLVVSFVLVQINQNPIISITLQIYFDLNTRKTLFQFDQTVGPAIDALTPQNYSTFNDVPRFIAPEDLATKITDIIAFAVENLDYLVAAAYPGLAAQNYPAPPVNSLSFEYSPSANGYVLNWPCAYEPPNPGTVATFFPVTAICLSFIFQPPNTIFTPGTPCRWTVTQQPSPANFRAVNRFASYTLGTTFADLNGTLLAGIGGLAPTGTFVKNTLPLYIPETDIASTAFAFCTIDVLQGLYQGSAGVPPPVPPAGQINYQIVSNAQFSGGGPPYLLLHASIMQSSKIKPMISAFHYPTSRYQPYSNTAFPWQGERSSTVLATIPIQQTTGISVMGSNYLYRHDNAHDELMEIVPDKTREVELWLTYPDGSDVLFYTQFPVFSINIVDNNEAI